MIFRFDCILLFNLIPNRLHHSTSKVLFCLVCYDCYLSLTLAPLKILVLPDWYLIMMIMMSTMISQLLALLTFLVVLLWSGVQVLVTQFINTTISGAVFGRQLVYDVRCRFVFWIADIKARDIVYRMIFRFDSILLFNLIPNRLHQSTSKVLFSLVCYDCYLSLTLAPLKILVLPDWYLIMMIMMSTINSQLLALLMIAALVMSFGWVWSLPSWFWEPLANRRTRWLLVHLQRSWRIFVSPLTRPTSHLPTKLQTVSFTGFDVEEVPRDHPLYIAPTSAPLESPKSAKRSLIRKNRADDGVCCSTPLN